MKTLAVATVLAVVFASAAPAQERKRLDLPAGMHHAPAAPVETTRPPGLTRILERHAEPADARVIASSGETPSRPATIDFYNNLTRSTWGQIRDGYDPNLPSGELKGENRWTMPPSVGVVVQGPLGPGSVGLNAGPGVQPDGTTGGVSINARLRVPFGR